MDGANKRMTILFDKYTDNVVKLQETMKQLGRNVEIVVLEDNGFLPHGISSPYEYFALQQGREGREEMGLFYNALEVPEFWEICMKKDMGGICDMGCEKAKIYFAEPVEKRIVQRVEWHMENGWIYKIDYYNKYGLKYAGEFLDENGNVESKAYYSQGNREVIVSQPQNDMIALLENGAVKFFFNSYYRFVEFYLGKIEGEIILFVQGAEQRELLGLERNGKSAWKSVLFAGRELWESYAKAGGKNGYRFYAIPERYPENHAGGNAMILTASDQIEKLEELAQELPEVIFHVAAHTQVSDKLYKLAERENVEVYPCISRAGLKDLWDKCDFYLDINHRREIDDAVNEASQRNLLILGFENTLHHREIMEEECVFPAEDYGKMALGIKRLLKDTEQMERILLKQQEKRKAMWQSILPYIFSGQQDELEGK